MPDRLDHSLLCPNQIQAHELVVDETPKQYSSRSSHSIHDPVTGITIPLYMHDDFSYFDVWLPSDEEFNELAWIELTSPNDWNESRITLAQNEPMPQIGIISAQEKPPKDPPLDELFTDVVLYKQMVSCVQTYSPNTPSVTVSALRTGAPKPLI
jgi:hypothetical protein